MQPVPLPPGVRTRFEINAGRLIGELLPPPVLPQIGKLVVGQYRPLPDRAGSSSRYLPGCEIPSRALGDLSRVGASNRFDFARIRQNRNGLPLPNDRLNRGRGLSMG